MSKIGTDVLRAFHEELTKQAWSPAAASVIGAGSSLGGAGLGAGALVGSIGGGIHGYRAAKREGATTRDAMRGAVSGGFRGARTGALVGGGLGLVGGAATGAISQGAGETLRSGLTNAGNGVGAFSRFGQRQAHAVTGWTPGSNVASGLAEIRHGSSVHLPVIEGAKSALKDAKSGVDARGAISRGIDRVTGKSTEDIRKSAITSAQKSLDSAHTTHAALLEAEKHNLTNIPGYLRGMRDDPLNTLSVAAKSQWRGMHPVDKAITVGLPGYMVAKEVLTKDDPEKNPPGSTKAKRLGGAIAATAAGTLLGPLPFVTQMALGSGADRVGNLAGSAVDRLRGKTPVPAGHVMAPKPPDLTADSGQSVPGERVVSERAAGSMGEGSPS